MRSTSPLAPHPALLVTPAAAQPRSGGSGTREGKSAARPTAACPSPAPQGAAAAPGVCSTSARLPPAPPCTPPLRSAQAPRPRPRLPAGSEAGRGARRAPGGRRRPEPLGSRSGRGAGGRWALRSPHTTHRRPRGAAGPAAAAAGAGRGRGKGYGGTAAQPLSVREVPRGWAGQSRHVGRDEAGGGSMAQLTARFRTENRR